MSEDFFDSILPPVKMSMIEQPQQPAAVKDEDVLRQEDGGDMMGDGVKQEIGGMGGKTSSTDLEKLWEEIYTSDDRTDGQMAVSVGGGGRGPGTPGNQGTPGTAAMGRGTPGASLGGLTAVNNGGKVFILSNKRKPQFVPEPPAKEMRLTAGTESRRIFQAALQNRSVIVNHTGPGPGGVPISTGAVHNHLNQLNHHLTLPPHSQHQLQSIIAAGGNSQVLNHQLAIDVRDTDEPEEEAEGHTEVYSQYQPLKLRRGKVHPYPVVESSSLSSVEVPNIRYSLCLPPEIMAEARLSNVQLEAVIYGCQRHEEILPTGERAGYLIGDGAGVGKGRTLAAIIYENYILRRKRSVWISVSNDLKHDAERDLRDLGASHIEIHALNKMRYAKINSPENGSVRKGVLFSTYASLIGECQTVSKTKYKTRFKQIVQWFGTDYDGVVVLDECHKAKNLMPQGSQKKTKTAEIVLKLQETLPKARVVYASATGASEPRNMAYMTRLGLWGPGTPFKKFEDFVEKLEDKVGAMELVAVDMKQRGMYIARQLSFANVTFRVHEVQLGNVKIGDHYFMDVYNESVDLWIKIFEHMNSTMSNKFVAKKHAKTIWGQYWAAHQRFFKYLCMAGKVQECVKITMESITQQKCVVIGLQSTGEAKTNEMLEDFGGEVTEFVSCARGILQSFVERFFPTDENISQMEKREDKSKSSQSTKPGRKKGGSKKPISLQDALGKDFLDKVTEEDGGSSDGSSHLSDSEDSDASLSEKSSRKRKVRPKDDGSDIDDDDMEILMDDFSRRYEDGSLKTGADVSCRMVQRELLDAIDRLAPKLPINTLDDLIRELGGPDYVAEMSGRKGRMVMDVNTGDVSYQPRREEDVTLEQVNMVEKERFNTCQKLVAIISDAASTGISLHADKRYENSLPRVHITLELPWSADRAIQQFGRTHRSNQLYPPEYVFLISDLAGERRFASTVAKRLESLGALTHGDRRATETRDLSQFNIDNKFGRRALDNIFDTAFKGKSSLVPMPQGIDLQQEFESVGLQPKDGKNVSKFLNRILGMRLGVQNGLFQYYTDTMDELIRQAKRNQEFDRGIIDLAKEDDNIFVEETQVFKMTFLGDDIKVQLHRVKNITGMSWRSAIEVPRGGNNSLDGFYITRNETQRKILLAVQKKDRHGTWFNVFSPNIGEQANMIEHKSLTESYKKASMEEAEKVWSEMYSVTENRCLHWYWYKQCNYSRNCDTGCRSKIRYVLSGSIFYIWDIISTINKSPQLARVRLNDGSKIIGCIINPSHKDKITEILANRESQPQQQKESGRQTSQQQKDRPMIQRQIRPLQSKLSSQEQFYVEQNLKNLSQRPRQTATIAASPTLRYGQPQGQLMSLPTSPQLTMAPAAAVGGLSTSRRMVFSSGILVPPHSQPSGVSGIIGTPGSSIRLVPISQNVVNKNTVLSPGLRLAPSQLASGGPGIRLIHAPQHQQHQSQSQQQQLSIVTATASPQIFNANRATTKSLELPGSFIEYTE